MGGIAIHGSCPECGAPYRADLWDRTHRCAYCDSLLALTRDDARDVYVVSDGRSGGGPVLDAFVRHEIEAQRARLAARFASAAPLALEPLLLDHPALDAFTRRLRRELALVRQVDFFAPYQLCERAVAHAALGRRGLAKESYLELFHAEEPSRRYDERAFHLRDRGLKIRGLELVRLSRAHLELAQGRFLPLLPGAPPEAGPDPARRRGLIRSVISRHRGVWRARRLLVYKHLSYAELARAGRAEHVLIDRQFGTIAARLDAREARTYRELGAGSAAGTPDLPDARVLASECPNCGWELRAGEQELISFCRSCRHAVTAGAKRLELVPYERGEPSAAGGEHVWFPFWAFPFALRAGGRRYTRIRDWLLAVSPQPGLEALAESGPDPSLYYVPARSLYGTPEADLAFERLVGFAGWRQPRLVRERPPPEDGARLPGVDLAAEEAAELARFALVCLHDNASTRRLNARNFAELIRDASLELGAARLAVLPLELRNGVWRPAGLRGPGVSGALLAGDPPASRATVTHGLAARARASS